MGGDEESLRTPGCCTRVTLHWDSRGKTKVTLRTWERSDAWELDCHVEVQGCPVTGVFTRGTTRVEFLGAVVAVALRHPSTEPSLLVEDYGETWGPAASRALRSAGLDGASQFVA
jgi:hypothetical protein